ARDRQRRPGAPPLEQRVGRDRRAEPHLAGRDRVALAEAEQPPDAHERRAIAGQDLGDLQRAARAIVLDAVRERAAAIDPERVAHARAQLSVGSGAGVTAVMAGTGSRDSASKWNVSGLASPSSRGLALATASSGTSTWTWPPDASLPNSSSSPSGRFTRSCTKRASGRAPLSRS